MHTSSTTYVTNKLKLPADLFKATDFCTVVMICLLVVVISLFGFFQVSDSLRSRRSTHAVLGGMPKVTVSGPNLVHGFLTTLTAVADEARL